MGNFNYFLHSAVSFIICIISQMMFHNIAISVLIACVVGVAKEIWDKYNPPHCCDIYDIIADCIGIGVFVILFL